MATCISLQSYLRNGKESSYDKNVAFEEAMHKEEELIPKQFTYALISRSYVTILCVYDIHTNRQRLSMQLAYLLIRIELL